MKTSFILFVSLSLFVCIGFVEKAQAQNPEKSMPNFEAGVFKRIDTVVVYDPATQIEQIRIISSNNIFLNLKDCNSLPMQLTSETHKVPFMQIQHLSGLEIRCNDKNHADWKIQSFDIAVVIDDNKADKISNKVPSISNDTGQFLSKLKAGDLVLFENVVLVNQQRDVSNAYFAFQLE